MAENGDVEQPPKALAGGFAGSCGGRSATQVVLSVRYNYHGTELVLHVWYNYCSTKHHYMRYQDGTTQTVPRLNAVPRWYYTRCHYMGWRCHMSRYAQVVHT